MRGVAKAAPLCFLGQKRIFLYDYFYMMDSLGLIKFPDTPNVYGTNYMKNGGERGKRVYFSPPSLMC